MNILITSYVRVFSHLDVVTKLPLLGERCKINPYRLWGCAKEACILKVPYVTLRDNIERPETVEVVVNVLADAKFHKIVENVKLMLGKEHVWKNLFGDGMAGERIAGIITSMFNNTRGVGKHDEGGLTCLSHKSVHMGRC